MQYVKATGGNFISPLVADRIVPGYYTSVTLDTQGHVIDKTAMISALDDYRAWGTIKEMHSTPVGVIEDIGTPYWNAIRARVVNTHRGDEVLQMVREGVYKAFSIGALVHNAVLVPFKDVPQDLFVGVPSGLIKNIKEYGFVLKILELTLLEVSIVDRPANPVALISEVKNFGPSGAQLLPSLTNRDGYDVLKGMYAIEQTLFAVNWESKPDEEGLALGINTEETNKMEDQIVEAADAEDVVTDTAVADETTEVPVVEEVVQDADTVAVEATKSVGATVVGAEEVTVLIDKSIARLEDVVTRLFESLNKSMADVASALEKSAEVAVSEAVVPEVTLAATPTNLISDEMIEEIATRVQASIATKRKATVPQASEAVPPVVDNTAMLKSLDVTELRKRIVDSLTSVSN